MVTSLRVLYAGPDHQTAAAALEEHLSQAQIEAVPSPAAALELLSDQYDCLVLAHTPEFDGLGLLRTARDRERDLPAVLFPERGDEALATRALRAGATDYVRRTSDQPYALLADRISDAVVDSGSDSGPAPEADQDPARHPAPDTDPAGAAVPYKALFTHANDAVAMVTFAGDVPTIETANELFIEQFAPEADLSELVGRDIDVVVAPLDCRESARSITDRVHDGELVTDTITRQTADGPRKFRFQAVPVGASELHAAPHAFAIYTDITQRDRQQQRLKTQTQKIATLHETAAEISRCGSDEAVYEVIAAAAEEILAFDTAIVNAAIDGSLVPQATSAELTADHYYDTVPVDADDLLVARAYRAGESHLVDDLREHDVSPADQAYRSVLTVPIADHGVLQAVAEETSAFDDQDRELAELLAAHADARLTQLATERQLRDRTAELERQNDRLEKFASVVSHDLRNPLQVAQARVELTRQTENHSHLDDAEAALDWAETLISDLLTLARQGQTVDDPTELSLAQAASDCWRSVKAPESTVDIVDDQRIMADPDRLRQLLENLFGNAVDHAGAAVHVTIGTLADADGFYIADDGPGIDPANRNKVFEGGYSTAEDGTGFGLRIVDEIATAHGWSVEVAESDAGGTRFEISDVESPAANPGAAGS